MVAKARRSRLGGGLLPAVMLVAAATAATLVGCKSQPEIDPYEMADERERERSDLLDREVEATQTEPDDEWESDTELVLPDPPEAPEKTIDGEFDDWDDEQFQSFESSEYVVDGEQRWGGSEDSSARVAARLGEGHLYMAVDVRDDTVVDAESVDPFADGVVVWLREPQLGELARELPEPVVEEHELDPEIGVLFTPDGQFWRRDEGPAGLYRRGIEAATVRTKRGYRVEIALELGTLRQVGRLPVPEVGFRVDIIDGDTPERRQARSTLSTIPPGRPEGRRFDLLDSEGWLPYASLAETPPREDAIGRWRVTKDGWTFDAVEVPPTNWRRFGQPGALEEAMREQGMLEEVCPSATRESRMVEAYTSRRGGERVALMVCGTPADDESCPTGAETTLWWLYLAEEGDGWSLGRAVRATDEPLQQCPSARLDGEPFYENFSLSPLGMIGEPVWAVGWHSHLEGSRGFERRSGIWVLNARKQPARVGEAQTAKTVADRKARTRSRSRVFLTEVDEKPGLDICEIERIEDQRCRGLGRGCRTVDRGTETTAHIRLWQPDEEVFERYLVSSHRDCDPPFRFSERDAYLLYHRGGRVGVIR